MNDLTDTDRDLDVEIDLEASLDAIAYKAERAAGRRLARAQGLSDAQALRRTLELSAGQAGLAALVAQRLALREAEAARAAARVALRAAAKARRDRAHESGHDDGHDGGEAARPYAWRAWFDGSARPNPGRCAIGVLLRGPDGAAIELAQPAGHGDSSDAEYRALIALLETALAHGVDDLAIHGDSQVVIGDVTGPDAHAAPVLRAYRDAARTLLQRFGRVSLRWVPRHKNQPADALSQRALPRSDSGAEFEAEFEADPEAEHVIESDAHHDPRSTA